MNLESLHVGMRVRHPQYGEGVVKTISDATAEVRFNEGVRVLAPGSSGLQPAEPQVRIEHLEKPLAELIRDTVDAAVTRLGLERPESSAGQLAGKWHKGKMVLHAADPTLQTKEVPLEVLFHKIVMVRNQLRVLEQKINGHEKLSDAEKVEMQQYITRCYGSLTTFNVLFKEKEDQF